MSVLDAWPGALFIAGYPIVFAIVSVLAYLVLRFGIRDGLRAHARWMERSAESRKRRPGLRDGDGDSRGTV